MQLTEYFEILTILFSYQMSGRLGIGECIALAVCDLHTRAEDTLTQSETKLLHFLRFAKKIL